MAPGDAHEDRGRSPTSARVVEAEPPAGDLSRSSTPRHGPISGDDAQQDGGKEDVSIDLDHPMARPPHPRPVPAAASAPPGAERAARTHGLR